MRPTTNNDMYSLKVKKNEKSYSIKILNERKLEGMY